MFYVYVLAALYVYFFPTILAIIIRHINPGAIFFTNLAIGWSVLGWFCMFAWVFDRGKEG